MFIANNTKKSSNIALNRVRCRKVTDREEYAVREESGCEKRWGSLCARQGHYQDGGDDGLDGQLVF
jgi:hypothetical protein